MARAGDVIESGRQPQCISFYSDSKDPERTPFSASQKMAKFFRAEVPRHYGPDNTLVEFQKNALAQIMKDAEQC